MPGASMFCPGRMMGLTAAAAAATDRAMAAKVKICGLKTREVLDAALEAGADYVGLVVYPPSPRHIEAEAAAPLAACARGRAAIVALLVDPDDALVRRAAEQIAPDIIQLHGSETPARAAAIGALARARIMKAIKVETAGDAAAAFAFAGAADMILFDAKAPDDLAGALPGGNGLTFDWHVLEGVRGKLDYMLSGGLTPDNVATAIRLTGAAAVDVSSGVESRPGVKDPGLIRRFIAAAKSSAAA